jgi:transposase
MPAPLSKDLRERFVRTWKAGRATTEELADRFGIGVATVGRWKRLFRENGNMAPRPHGGGQQRRIVGNAERELKKLVEAHPDWTEEELTTELVEKHGVSASSVTVGRAVRRLGYSVKKRPSSLQSATEQTCFDEEKSTFARSPARPLHVWFLWTKPARTSR